MSVAPYFATCGILLAGVMSSHGKIKLLTGSSSNTVHEHDSTLLDLSTNGDVVLFSSGPPAVGGTPGIALAGLYVRKISSNTLRFAGDPLAPAAVEASFSDNGRYITWRGTDSFIYWRDSIANVTRLITPAADGLSRRPVMSADGRYVAYASKASNVVSNKGKLQQVPARPGVYLYDSITQKTVVVSLTQSGDSLDTGIGSPTNVPNAGNEFDFSSDGKYIVFSSDAKNAHPGRPSNFPATYLCIYRRNLATGALDLLNENAAGSVADGNFYSPRISGNGARVTFFGQSVGVFQGIKMINSVPSNFSIDLYVKEVGSGDVWWVTKTTDNFASDGAYSPYNVISGDGETVAFGSNSTRFVTEKTDPLPGNRSASDVFRVDLGSAGKVKTTLVTSSPNASGNVDFRVGPLLPGNGDYVAFCTSQVEAMFGIGSNDTVNFQGFSVSEPAKPEIVVQQPAGSGLQDGKDKKKFGSVTVGQESAAKTFTIKNIGTKTLKNLEVKKSGSHKGDFIVGPLAKTSLAPGKSTTFQVSFKPTAKDTRNASLKISSNDFDENPFDIKLVGTGVKP